MRKLAGTGGPPEHRAASDGRLLRLVWVRNTASSAGSAALFVATVRDDPAEASPEASELPRSRPAGVERLVLAGLDAAEVAELAGRVLGALDEAAEARLVQAEGGDVRFVHALVRETVYACQPVARTPAASTRCALTGPEHEVRWRL